MNSTQSNFRKSGSAHTADGLSALPRSHGPSRVGCVAQRVAMYTWKGFSSGVRVHQDPNTRDLASAAASALNNTPLVDGEGGVGSNAETAMMISVLPFGHEPGHGSCAADHRAATDMSILPTMSIRGNPFDAGCAISRGINHEQYVALRQRERAAVRCHGARVDL